MRHFLKSTAGAFILSLLFSACQKDNRTALEPGASPEEESTVAGRGHGYYGPSAGNVYTLSNAADGNKVIEYRRNANGTLTPRNMYATGGNGTGGGLGNQGAVILTGDDDVLLAVNAGSNTISSFKVRPNGLQLRSTVSSGGMRPVSITEHNGIVYVLNAGGNGNISGFRLLPNDKLEPLPHSTRPLSVNAPTAPAQVSFARNGRVLVITEKATNTITTYTVNYAGIPGVQHHIISATPTPFGFDTGRFGNIFVSEAAGGAPGASVVSSYQVGFDGSISLINGSIGAGESAACWVVITGNGRYAYTTNTASNTITAFNTNVFNGSLSVSQAIAATTQAGPIDAALSSGSRYLYVLNGAAGSIDGFEVAINGSLSPVQTLTGLPAGANGLAAR